MPDNNKVRKALVLEDEPIITKILGRMLKAAGMTADMADNGLSARDNIDAGKEYDVFIFDIRTPVISGIQLYDYMEEFYPDLTEKVIFMTGDYLNAVTCAFLERVKRPCINKPFMPNQIMDLIKTAIQPEWTSV
jgi:DNA-binding NtrC family response regulator